MSGASELKVGQEIVAKVSGRFLSALYQGKGVGGKVLVTVRTWGFPEYPISAIFVELDEKKKA